MHSIHSLESFKIAIIEFKFHAPVFEFYLSYLIVTYPILLATAKCSRDGSYANALAYYSEGRELIELAPP
jgi:hypothetical protein